jgi:hypothetical protein
MPNVADWAEITERNCDVTTGYYLLDLAAS